ncbi:MAG TPA: hypothetical protein H9851_02470 [Candidatus Borkfalkia faecavium]|uniref:Uncharacterized protein n=1 Tax=Candidatus Borkfalkia faecavium TaxID=2838508 RepID=A0A9D2AV04_9FIRM|nr:hypothetical protein [Candidatus Borkfalkia faecavium]
MSRVHKAWRRLYIYANFFIIIEHSGAFVKQFSAKNKKMLDGAAAAAYTKRRRKEVFLLGRHPPAAVRGKM